MRLLARLSAVTCACFLGILHSGIAAQPSSTRQEVKSGTGFFVSEHGILLTSAHVVTECHAISVWPPESPGVPARVLAMDDRLDIAALSVGDSAPTHGLRPAFAEALPDQAVSIISFGVHRSAPRVPAFVDGRVLSGAPRRNGWLVTIQAPVQPGASGAPVVNARGAVIGIVVGQQTAASEVAVAVSSDAATAFLHAQGITIPALPSAMVGPSEPRSILQRMAVLVQCTPNTPPPR